MEVPGATPGPVTASPITTVLPLSKLVTVSVVPDCAADIGVDEETACGLPLTV